MASGEVAQRRGEDARKVDTPVLLEVLVFNGRDRVVEDLGALLVGHQDAALQRETADELAVIRVDLRDHIGAVGFERANLRQIADINEKQSAGDAKQNRAEQEKGQSDAIDQLETAQP